MSGNLSIINFGQYARVASRSSVASTPTRQVASAPINVAELSLSRYQLLRLRDALETAMKATGAARVTGNGSVDVASGPLMLDNSSRSAVLRSGQEINTAETSFSPFGPDWTRLGTSTAQVTIGGVYNGSSGTGALLFRVRVAGDHSQDDLRIQVRDADNRNISLIDIAANDSPDQIYDVGNGLTLQLGPGRLVRNDEFALTVSDSVGSVVSTTKPFDGVRSQNPNLDLGQSVASGSLIINGTLIPILASDSISSVLDTINQSAAGVTAAFDPVAEGLVLTQNTPGAAPTINIQVDTSGFAAATKLSGASVAPGKDPELISPLRTVAQFAAVQSGTISVNGVDMPIDIATDSLADVLQRISSSSNTVTASFAENPQRVSLSSRRPISLSDGGTGLLDALGISAASYRSSRGNSISGGRAAAIQGAVGNMANVLNNFLTSGETGSAASPFRRQLAAVVDNFLSAEQGSRYGLHFRAGRDARLDVSSLGRSLANDGRQTLAFLNGNEARGGFLEAAARNVDQAIAVLNQRLGLRGSTIDQFV